MFVLPQSIWDRKANEFNDFFQGTGMSVTKYEEKFKDLSRIVVTRELYTIRQIAEAARWII